MPGKHSLYPPSSAHRWVNCTASLAGHDGRYEESPDSEFSAHGTAAHELAAACLNSGNDPEVYYLEGTEFYGRAIDDEMLRYITEYVHRIRQETDNGLYELMVEYETHMPTIHEDAYGTSDARLFSARKRHLKTFDLKYGAGKPEYAEDNWQLAQYAIGQMRELQDQGFEVAHVSMFIYQPRYWGHEEPWMRWDVEAKDLEPFEKRLRKAANAKQRTFVPGDWCRWCPRGDNLECPVLNGEADELATLADGERSFMQWDAADLVELYDKAPRMRSFLKALEDHITMRLQCGMTKGIEDAFTLRDIKSKRFWTNPARTATVLRKHIGNAVYEEPKLKSPSQMEKAGISKDLVKSLCDTKITGQELVRKKGSKEHE